MRWMFMYHKIDPSLLMEVQICRYCWLAGKMLQTTMGKQAEVSLIWWWFARCIGWSAPCAASEQNSRRYVFGDDFHHNELFCWVKDLNTYLFEHEKETSSFPFQFDLYDCIRNCVNEKYFHKKLPTWNDLQHIQTMIASGKQITMGYVPYPQTAMLHVGGYFGQKTWTAPLMYRQRGEVFLTQLHILGPPNHGCGKEISWKNFTEIKTGEYFRDQEKMVWLLVKRAETENLTTLIASKPVAMLKKLQCMAERRQRKNYTLHLINVHLKSNSADSLLTSATRTSCSLPNATNRSHLWTRSRWYTCRKDQRSFSRPDVISFTSIHTRILLKDRKDHRAFICQHLEVIPIGW